VEDDVVYVARVLKKYWILQLECTAMAYVEFN
jgi:hypothetical protein